MNERKLFPKSNSNTSINENETSNFFQQYSKKKFDRIYSKNIKSLKSKNGITLIALVISIIVMLILAGVSLNATIGDNGIITQAQNATYMQSVAVLEEYFNNYYVEHYDEMNKKDESKVLTLTTMQPSWFYIPANEGVGGLRYIVDSEGHALYLIKKSGLPEEIKNQIKGGEAGEGKYSDYAGLNDVYGLTSDLNVYYCSNGADTIMGKTLEDLDADNPLREVFNSNANSDIYELLKDYDVADATGNKDGKLTAEELKSVTKLKIDKKTNIADFSMFYNLPSLRELTIENKTLNNLAGIENCPQLNYVYLKSSVISDYSSLSKVNKLKYLYLYNIDDNELTTLCNGIKDAQFSDLEYLAIVGNNNAISDTDVVVNVYDTKVPNPINSLEPITQLSDTTKKAVKYLSINNNNISGDLSVINDFTSLILLRCEYNNLTSLDGLQNMNNLAYLCAVGNKIGTVTKEDGSLESESAETGTSISSLANKKQLYQVNLKNNSNLTNVSYFKENTELKYLHLAGCSTTMNVNVIKDRILACGSNYSLPVKFLIGTVYNVADYYTPANVTYEELYSDLYDNTTITHLNLDGCTKITNEQFNTILKSMTQLKYLTIKDNPKLTTIDFVAESTKTTNGDGTYSYTYSNPKCTNLVELDLINTNVSDLTPLNQYAEKLSTLRVSDGSDFKNIAPTINRLNGEQYWCNPGYYGLVCSNIETFKCLEEVKDLTFLRSMQYLKDIGNVDDVDLTNTNLKTISISGVNANIYLPNTIEEIYCDGLPLPVITENSTKLNKITITNVSGIDRWKNKFFPNLKNTTNLKSLSMTRLANLKFYKISDYIIDEMPSVTTLILSGQSFIDRLSELNSLEGIEKFPNITTLYSNYTNNILDISNIKNCTKLKSVYLSYANIQSLNGLEDLTSLQRLDLKNNNISSLKPLEKLTNLQILNLSNNVIADSSAYSDTDGSTKRYNNLEILANLNKNGKLKTLYLEGNDNIIDWSPLSKLSWEDKSGW